jgi:hypothetical protein
VALYVKQTWEDGNPLYPVSAARLNFIEEGIRRASIDIATSLPVTPEHGDEVYYDAGTNTLWPLVYDSMIVAAHKWRAIGPMPLQAEVATAELPEDLSEVDYRHERYVLIEGEYVHDPTGNFSLQVGVGAADCRRPRRPRNARPVLCVSDPADRKTLLPRPRARRAALRTGAALYPVLASFRARRAGGGQLPPQWGATPD